MMTPSSKCWRSSSSLPRYWVETKYRLSSSSFDTSWLAMTQMWKSSKWSKTRFWWGKAHKSIPRSLTTDSFCLSSFILETFNTKVLWLFDIKLWSYLTEWCVSKGFQIMKTLIGSDEVSSLEVPILELSGWPTCSAIPSCQRLSLLLSAVQPRSELEEFYRRFFHLVCLNLPIMFKCLRLYVSTSYFKTDIVLFPAPSTLVIWLWRIFQKSYQQVFACETPTIC